MAQLNLFGEDEEVDDGFEGFNFDVPVITETVEDSLPTRGNKKPKIVVEPYSAEWILRLLNRKILKKFDPNAPNPLRAAVKANNFIDALKLTAAIGGHTAAKKSDGFDGEQYIEFKEV